MCIINYYFTRMPLLRFGGNYARKKIDELKQPTRACIVSSCSPGHLRIYTLKKKKKKQKKKKKKKKQKKNEIRCINARQLHSVARSRNSSWNMRFSPGGSLALYVYTRIMDDEIAGRQHTPERERMENRDERRGRASQSMTAWNFLLRKRILDSTHAIGRAREASRTLRSSRLSFLSLPLASPLIPREI